MGDLSNVTFQPQNPYALFSPDQWLKPVQPLQQQGFAVAELLCRLPDRRHGQSDRAAGWIGIPDYAQWQANQAAPCCSDARHDHQLDARCRIG